MSNKSKLFTFTKQFTNTMFDRTFNSCVPRNGHILCFALAAPARIAFIKQQSKKGKS